MVHYTSICDLAMNTDAMRSSPVAGDAIQLLIDWQIKVEQGHSRRLGRGQKAQKRHICHLHDMQSLLMTFFRMLLSFKRIGLMGAKLKFVQLWNRQDTLRQQLCMLCQARIHELVRRQMKSNCCCWMSVSVLHRCSVFREGPGMLGWSKEPSFS